MNNNNDALIAIGMEYACHSVDDAIDELRKALEFDTTYIQDFFDTSKYSFMCLKVLSPRGRGISLRRTEQK